MNKKWYRQFAFYIDPKFKSSDKELFRIVSADLESLGANLFDDASEKLNSKLPSIFLVNSDSETDFHIKDHDHTFVFGGANMSIFGQKQFPGRAQSIENASDWGELFKRLDELFFKDCEALERELIDSALKNFKLLVKRGKTFDFGRQIPEFEEFQADLYSALERDDIAEILSRHSRGFKGASFTLLEAPIASSLETNDLLPLKRGEEILFLKYAGEPSDEMILKVYSSLEDVFKRQAPETNMEGKFEDMEFIISDLPIPLALFNQHQELALHNPAFVRLNLSVKNCLALEDGKQFNHRGELYRSARKALDKSGFELFTFLPVKEFLGQSSAPSSEELGIISSSIAHELNNPLGGVSGALDVLLLDEHKGDIKERMQEMKGGVLRCKKLVETFLGFSKLEARGQAAGENSVQSCVESAMELVRFRLIENNISLVPSFEQKSVFSQSFNPHVLSMTFYLVIGDLLTGFGHHNLIAGERSANFKVSITENKDAVSIEAKDCPGLGEDFLKSKLLNHLLDIQELEIEVGRGRVRLIA